MIMSLFDRFLDSHAGFTERDLLRRPGRGEQNLCGRKLAERCALAETASVTFVADDLGAWLIGLLAEAGRKKLTALVLGSDQERALRKAATEAVQDTAAEMNLSAEQARRIAMVISKAFRKPVQDTPLAGAVTMLEMLQVGVVRQLAVLDDAGRPGTGLSPTGALPMPGTVLAEN